MTTKVRLLGGACLLNGDTLLSGPPTQRHRIALLTLIVAAWPQPFSRDRALALLWPERDLTGGRRLLNLAVHVLRSALGETAIVSTGGGLLLNPSCLSCDLHELRTAIAAGEDERVVRLYTAPLLDGFHLPESTEFGYWLDQHRSELAHAYTGALLALAERQEQSGDLRGRVDTCRRLVAADPYSGVHAQALMRALDACGDRASATLHASQHAHRLRMDLDLDPHPDVIALAEQLRSVTPPRRPLQSGVPCASVAVLPFLNMSADPDNEYFSDGITDDVIAHLSRIRALQVISRTSVLPFKQRQHTLKEIGSALGVTTVLDGSVRHAGDRVRVVATLVDVATDRQLWAGTYDRQIADVFAIQTDVALQIAAALEAELSADESTRVGREPTHDLQAYRLFLQGRRWMVDYTLPRLMRATDFFERAIARDPAFALAHATLAMACTELSELGAPPETAYARAGDAAAIALRLDPDLGLAHCAMGHLRAVRDLDFTGAEQNFRRALELSPSSADTYDLYGRLCAGLERYDDSLRLLERAQQLDPLNHRLDPVTTLLRAGRLDEALERAMWAVEIDPSGRARATLGWAYFLSGRQAEGLAELQAAVSQSPGETVWLAQLGEAYGLAGHEEKARAILRDLETRARHAFISPYHLAYVCTGLGEYDKAVAYLEEAVANGSGGAYSMRGAFLFASLRTHAGFQALLRQMGQA